jgi:hypothetical protein
VAFGQVAFGQVAFSQVAVGQVTRIRFLQSFPKLSKK